MNKPHCLRYYERQLERERERLGRLIDAAMDGPIALNEEILAQSRIVDGLLARLGEKEEGEREREHSGSL